MITEQQIKARFNQNHLRALVRRMLKLEFYDYHNHKRDEHPTPLYTLLPGVTPELISKGVRFCEIWNSETNAAAKLYGEWYQVSQRTGEGRWRKADFLRMRRMGEGFYTILDNQSYGGELERIDNWLQNHLLDHDQWMRNNSAIDIYI